MYPRAGAPADPTMPEPEAPADPAPPADPTMPEPEAPAAGPTPPEVPAETPAPETTMPAVPVESTPESVDEKMVAEAVAESLLDKPPLPSCGSHPDQVQTLPMEIAEEWPPQPQHPKSSLLRWRKPYTKSFDQYENQVGEQESNITIKYKNMLTYMHIASNVYMYIIYLSP